MILPDDLRATVRYFRKSGSTDPAILSALAQIAGEMLREVPRTPGVSLDEVCVAFERVVHGVAVG
jgi:hypothetical protein